MTFLGGLDCVGASTIGALFVFSFCGQRCPVVSRFSEFRRDLLLIARLRFPLKIYYPAAISIPY